MNKIHRWISIQTRSTLEGFKPSSQVLQIYSWCQPVDIKTGWKSGSNLLQWGWDNIFTGLENDEQQAELEISGYSGRNLVGLDVVENRRVGFTCNNACACTTNHHCKHYIFESWSNFQCMSFCRALLTDWGQDKMAAISQMTFSTVFSWMKTFDFKITFHWNIFLGV